MSAGCARLRLTVGSARAARAARSGPTRTPWSARPALAGPARSAGVARGAEARATGSRMRIGAGPTPVVMAVDVVPVVAPDRVPEITRAPLRQWTGLRLRARREP